MTKTQKIIRAISVGIAVLTGACSGAGLNDPVGVGDVASVTVMLATAPHALNGFEESPESVELVADVMDSRNNAITDRPVTWDLRLPNGVQAGDTIASIKSTGQQTATIAFHSDVVVGVVASVHRADGAIRSDTMYMVRSR